MVKKRSILTFLLLCFILRGVIQITLVPPLDGFDSIGHIDYMQYLREYSKRSIEHMPLSKDVLGLFAIFPNSKHCPAPEYGGRQFEDYYNRTLEEFDSLKTATWNKPLIWRGAEFVESEENWQNKHPPLYYNTLNFLTGILKPKLYMVWYYLSSFFSLLILSSTILIFYLFGKQIGKNSAHGDSNYGITFSFLFVIQSMIYIVASRITNDALAYPLNALVCYFLYRSIDEPSSSKWNSFKLTFFAACVTGLSFWVKTYALLFVPSAAFLYVVFWFFTRRSHFLINAGLFIIVSVGIACPLLYHNYTFTGQIDGNTVIAYLKSHDIQFNMWGSIIDNYLFSIDGYLQMFKMVITRIWLGNWSSFANVPVIYPFFFGLYGFTLYKMFSKIKAIRKELKSASVQFLLFSIVLQGLLILGLVRIGLQTSAMADRVTAVAGYYSYAFYITGLYIFWFFFRDNRKLFPGLIGMLFIVTDFCGLFMQLLYYYGGGYKWKGSFIIPFRDFVSRIICNWDHATWTFIPLYVWCALCVVYFVMSIRFLFFFDKIKK